MGLPRSEVSRSEVAMALATSAAFSTGQLPSSSTVHGSGVWPAPSKDSTPVNCLKQYEW